MATYRPFDPGIAPLRRPAPKPLKNKFTLGVNVGRQGGPTDQSTYGVNALSPIAPIRNILAPAAPGAINVNTGLGAGYGSGGAFNPGELGASMSEIMADPVYQAALQAKMGSEQSGRSSLRDAIRQAVIKGGWDITGKLTGDLAGYAGDITAADRAAAAANQMSTKAQLDKQLAGGMTDLDYQLAARGMLRSGAVASGGRALNEQYQGASNTAMGDLLDAIRGGVGSYAQLQREEQGKLSGVLSDVASRLAQQKSTAAYYSWLASQGQGQGQQGWTSEPTAYPDMVTYPQMPASLNPANWGQTITAPPMALRRPVARPVARPVINRRPNFSSVLGIR